jgi:hypothetical protein
MTEVHIVEEQKKEVINLAEGHEKLATAFFIIFFVVVFIGFILFIAKVNSGRIKSSDLSTPTQTPINNSNNQNQSVNGVSTVIKPEGPGKPSYVPPTLTPTFIPTPTDTPVPTSAPNPTNTPVPTDTPTPTPAFTPTPTSSPSATPTPS